MPDPVTGGLCAALMASTLTLSAVDSALDQGASPTETCAVERTRNVMRFDAGEVFLSVIFPPFLLGKLIFGGEAEAYTIQVAPLVLAVGRRNPAVVDRLLQAGAPPDDAAVEAAINDAVSWGHFDIVALLLDAGALPQWSTVLDPDAVLALLDMPGAWQRLTEAGASVDVGSGETALDIAVKRHDRSAVEKLLAAGASPEGRASLPPVAVALQDGDHALAARLVAAGASLGRAGPTALQAAATRGDLTTMAWLVERGVPITADPKQQTVLYAAASAGQARAAQWLIDHGADPHTPDPNGRPLTWAAIEGGQVALLQTLANAGVPLRWEDQSALLLAARTGKTEVITYLLSQDFTVTETDTAGLTALDHAVQACQEAAARLLIQRGAKVGVAPGHDHTILHAAVLANSPSAIRFALRLSKSVTIETPDAQGRTALLYAVQTENSMATSTLIDLGANTNVQDAQGRGLLHHAVLLNDSTTVSVLLRELSAHAPQDHNGDTPLHLSVAHRNLVTTGQLIDAHVPLDIQNQAGQTPLHLTTDPYIARRLVQAGARADIMDQRGQTALDLAVASGKPDLVTELSKAPYVLPATPYQLQPSSEEMAYRLAALQIPFTVRGGLELVIAEHEYEMVKLLIAQGEAVEMSMVRQALLEEQPQIAALLVRALPPIDAPTWTEMIRDLRQAEVASEVVRWARKQRRESRR